MSGLKEVAPKPAGRAPFAAIHRAVLVLHGLLMLGLLAWTRDVIGLLLVLPLAAAIPGLARGRRYTGGWMTLLLVIYMAGLIAEAGAMPSRRLVGLGLATVAVLEFVSLVLFVRWSARADAAQTGPAPAA